MDKAWRVTVCDDDNECIETIHKYIISLLPDFEFKSYNKAEDLLKVYKEKRYPYDIIFMDIELDGLNGIACANKIRENDRNAVIIFFTSHKKYMEEFFDCQPFRFMHKPVSYEKFREEFLKATKIINSDRPYVCFQDGKETIRLFCEEIMFFENKSHWVYIHTKSDIYKIYTTFNDIMKKINSNNFVKTHRAYIVNLDYVKKFDNSNITILNYDLPIPLSRSLKKEFKSKFWSMQERRYIL